MNGQRGPSPRGATGPAVELLLAGAMGVVLVLAGAVWVPVALADAPGASDRGPIAAVVGLMTGQVRWTLGCTLVAVGELVLLALATVGVTGLVSWHRRRRTRVDAAADRMASRRDVAHLGPEAVEAAARRLRPSLDPATHVELDQAGVLIGHAMDGGMPLLQSWEDMAVDVWGPRTGKTTARAIPAVVAAPGPVLVTSVKGDVVDATRDLRAARGAVWVFDPQQILDQPRRLWWNPLGGIRTITDARRLAEHFAAAEREPGIHRDAFFDPSSAELVANLLLAAAAGGRSVLDAYRWAVNPRDDEPAALLHGKGFVLPGEAVNGVINMPDKTRGGIYAGAQKMLMCLTEPSVTAWVTPPRRSGTTAFDPTRFVATTDTLYLLSQGGPGSPAPLIAALTDTVLRAGETRARASSGRRLDPPLLGVLDEAANICRIQQLPALYSYYGSHGLPIITILQSYAQGIDVWGREGMRKLWSAANVRTYGGGVADPEFLDELSKLIGEHDITTQSTSAKGFGWEDWSVSHAPRRQRILDISDLHALPRGRVVVYSSGAPPVLARTAPWQHGPHAESIRASIARWDPEASADWGLQPDTVDPL
ncbi:MAG: type IV secretory system conjugative DNA transfer family protein [Dactylosporangium sp.]|nr:TraM recognition domain-containing protein [Dactylosporangium sp.]NNJ60345.1 type IV secretory system conjugative DNA transfer family protein [Dactylosporangium sp.]